MKLYLLRRRDEWSIGYDEYQGFVVRAHSEYEARAIANSQHADEGQIWSSARHVSCTVLTNSGDPGVVLASFNAG